MPPRANFEFNDTDWEKVGSVPRTKLNKAGGTVLR